MRLYYVVGDMVFKSLIEKCQTAFVPHMPKCIHNMIPLREKKKSSAAKLLWGRKETNENLFSDRKSR